MLLRRLAVLNLVQHCFRDDLIAKTAHDDVRPQDRTRKAVPYTALLASTLEYLTSYRIAEFFQVFRKIRDFVLPAGDDPQRLSHCSRGKVSKIIYFSESTS
jgi:hypothetical protein